MVFSNIKINVDIWPIFILDIIIVIASWTFCMTKLCVVSVSNALRRTNVLTDEQTSGRMVQIRPSDHDHHLCNLARNHGSYDKQQNNILAREIFMNRNYWVYIYNIIICTVIGDRHAGPTTHDYSLVHQLTHKKAYVPPWHNSFSPLRSNLWLLPSAVTILGHHINCTLHKFQSWWD